MQFWLKKYYKKILLPVKFKIYKFRFAFSKHFIVLPWGFMVWKIIKFTIGVEIGKTHTVQYSVHSLRCISFCAKLHTYYLWSSDPIFILQETNSKNSIKPHMQSCPRNKRKYVSLTPFRRSACSYVYVSVFSQDIFSIYMRLCTGYQSSKNRWFHQYSK